MYHFLYSELIHLLFALYAGYCAHLYYRAHKNEMNNLPVWLIYATAILSGFFIDIDHLFDYVIAFGITNFNLMDFIRGTFVMVNDKFILPFHGYEYGILLLTMFYLAKKLKTKVLLLALALGLSFHVVTDAFSNGLQPKTYSILYRAYHNFDAKVALTEEQYQKHLQNREVWLLQQASKENQRLNQQ